MPDLAFLFYPITRIAELNPKVPWVKEETPADFSKQRVKHKANTELKVGWNEIRDGQGYPLGARRSTELPMLKEQVGFQASKEEITGPGFSTVTICFLFGPRTMELVVSCNDKKAFQSKSLSPSAEQEPLSKRGKPAQPPVALPPYIPLLPRCLLYF